MPHPPARRRPREPAPRSPAPPEDARTPPAGRPANRFAPLLAAVALLVVGVLVVALATGTQDDLPWGAIIGVAVVAALLYARGRRRPPDGDAG